MKTQHNWTTAANWGGTAPVADDDLLFNGVVRLNPNNDFASGTAFSTITFLSSAGSFVLAGNGIQLSGGIGHGDNNNQTINIPLELIAPVSMQANGTVAGANITIGGTISGAFGITKTGSRALILNAANNYAGGTILDAGTIQLGAIDGALGSGGFEFAGGTLEANNRTENLGALTLSATSTLNLAPGGSAGIMTFASATASVGEVLNINGWSGSAGSAGTDDRIFITADPGATVLDQINFVGFGTAMWLGTGEIVPVPEPTEWALIAFAALSVLYKFVLPRLRKSIAVTA